MRRRLVVVVSVFMSGCLTGWRAPTSAQIRAEFSPILVSGALSEKYRSAASYQLVVCENIAKAYDAKAKARNRVGIGFGVAGGAVGLAGAAAVITGVAKALGDVAAAGSDKSYILNLSVVGAVLSGVSGVLTAVGSMAGTDAAKGYSSTGDAMRKASDEFREFLEKVAIGEIKADKALLEQLAERRLCSLRESCYRVNANGMTSSVGWEFENNDAASDFNNTVNRKYINTICRGESMTGTAQLEFEPP